MGEHICDATVPVCSCGRRWEFYTRWADGQITYVSAEMRARYVLYYGEPTKSMFPVEEKKE